MFIAGIERNSVTTHLVRAQNRQAVNDALATRPKRPPAPSPTRGSPRKKQHTSKAWELGDHVQVIFQAYKLGSGAEYPGVVHKKNSNGSYVIHYNDGDVEKNVLEKNISPAFANMDEFYGME